MSKRFTTHWYIRAWVVWVLALVALGVAMQTGPGSSSSPQPLALLAYLVMGVAGVVMLVMWIGALIKLGQQHAWGWIVAVLVLHLLALGIIGMVAYAIAGPTDTEEVVIRPTTT